MADSFKRFPEEVNPITESWNRTENIRLIRSSILFQLSCKDKVDLDLLTRLIIPHKESREFFIQKVIGWSLRQVSK